MLVETSRVCEKSAVDMREGVLMDGIGQSMEAPERACTDEARGMRQERDTRHCRKAHA